MEDEADDFIFPEVEVKEQPGAGLAPDRETELRIRSELDKRDAIVNAKKRNKKAAEKAARKGLI